MEFGEYLIGEEKGHSVMVGNNGEPDGIFDSEIG